MGKYTDEQWKVITNANCVNTALALGFQIDENCKDKKAFHIKDNGGFYVWKNGSGFLQFSSGDKGRAVDLVMKTLGIKYGEALDWINGNVLNGEFKTQQQTYFTDSHKTQEKADFKLPEKTRPSNAYAYLLQRRGLDKEIVSALFNEGSIFQDSKNRNVCFVGFDKQGEAKYCAMRGTGDAQYRGEASGSDKRFGFAINGNSSVLKIFESPIEALSHATLAKMSGKDWKADTRLSLGGCVTLALEQHLADRPGYSEIWICLNNDEAGIKTANRIKEMFGDEYNLKIKLPRNKDFNDDLIEAKSLMNERGCAFQVVLNSWKTGEPIGSNNQLSAKCVELTAEQTFSRRFKNYSSCL
ncbi:MAG: DUF3991 and toprim domain-containing protein [Oscillospiraceae bacterium]|nr:DUF3991 and toprim domain-containing protein [Oscillospiraceae bacterium]